MTKTAETAEAPKVGRVNSAYLTGGSTKGVTSVITVLDDYVGLESKTAKAQDGSPKKYTRVTAEMAVFDGANTNQPMQKNPLYFNQSSGVTKKNGKPAYNTTQVYSPEAVDQLLENAVVQPIYKHEQDENGDFTPVGEPIGRIAVVDVDLYFGKTLDGTPNGLRMKPDTAKAPSVEVPENVQNAQFEGAQKHREVANAEISARAAAKAAEKDAAKEEPTKAAPAADEGIGY